MDLDLSNVSKTDLNHITSSLMGVSKTEFNMFYPNFLYNVITSNEKDTCSTLLESLPIYITSCLSYPENEYISEYEELKFKLQKYYICEIVVKLLIYYHKKSHSTKDLCYFHSKKAVKMLVQNIFEDLNCYEVVFLCSLSDTIADYIKSEKHSSEDEDEEFSMRVLNDEIFCLLITLMHNLNERTRGIVGFQKLELVKQHSTEESKEEGSRARRALMSKQLIDQYFKIQSNRSDSHLTDEKLRQEITRINNSVMKLVL